MRHGQTNIKIDKVFTSSVVGPLNIQLPVLSLLYFIITPLYFNVLQMNKTTTLNTNNTPRHLFRLSVIL